MRPTQSKIEAFSLVETVLVMIITMIIVALCLYCYEVIIKQEHITDAYALKTSKGSYMHLQLAKAAYASNSAYLTDNGVQFNQAENASTIFFDKDSIYFLGKTKDFALAAKTWNVDTMTFNSHNIVKRLTAKDEKGDIVYTFTKEVMPDQIINESVNWNE